MRTLPYYLIVFVALISQAFASSGTLYQFEDKKLTYNSDDDSYVLDAKGESYTLPRHRYKELIREHAHRIPENDRTKFIETVNNHALIQMLSNPSDEEIIGSALKMQATAAKVIEKMASPQDCDGSPGNLSPKIDLKYKVSEEKLKKNKSLLKDLSLKGDGFMKLGDLKGFSLELDTSNDNPLHGGLKAMGLTTFKEKPEGDDRGKTFGEALKAKLQFEKGHISFKQYSDLYGRLAPKILFKGKPYETKLHLDENGHTYVESLVVEGYELEVLRTLDNDVYVKVIGRTKTLNDEGGIGIDLQKKWHESTDSVIYNYRDHMDKKTGYEGYLEIGKEFTLHQTDDMRISSMISGGTNYSTLGKDHKFLQARGDIKVEFFDTVDGNKFPSWEAKVYIQAKKYADKEDATLKGIEIKKRFAIDKNQFIYINAALDQEDDRLNRDYGGEELDRNGSLDFQHKLGIGYEYKF